MKHSKTRVIVFLLLIVILVSGSEPKHAEAAGVFGQSWVNDTSLYWQTASSTLGGVPDTFDYSYYENYVTQAESVSSKIEEFTDAYKSNMSTERYNWFVALRGYIEFVYNNCDNLKDRIEDYNNTDVDKVNRYEDLYDDIVKKYYAQVEQVETMSASFFGIPGKTFSDWIYDYNSFVKDLFTDKSTGKIYSGSETNYNYYRIENFEGSSKSYPYTSTKKLLSGYVSVITKIMSYDSSYHRIDKVSKIESSLASLLVGIGSGLEGMAAENGVDITTIIFGRVKTAGGQNTTVNYFSFELERDNIYGVIGAILYAVLRNVFVIGASIMLLYYLVRASLTNSPRVLEGSKSNIAYALVSIALLVAMPNLVDLIIYGRDILLKIVGEQLGSWGSDTGSTVSGLLDKYFALATDADNRTNTFTNATVYFGMVVVSLYYMFTYIAAACSMAIIFGFFPLFVFFSFNDRKLVGTWLNACVGTILTPVIDCALLYVPLIGATVGAPDIVTIILCMSIIPARSTVRRLLGFGQSTGAELLGVGALMGAARAVGGLTRNLKNTVGKVSGNIRQNKQDKAMAHYYSKLDEIEQDEEGYPGLAKGTGAGVGGAGGVGVANMRLNYKTDTELEFAKGKAADDDKRASDKAGRDIDINTRLVNEREEADTRAKGEAGVAETVASIGNARRSEALADIANVNNFEDKNIFGNLTNKQKAEFYKQRVHRNRAEAIGTVAGGTVGAVAGGAVGFGAGVYFGPSATALTTGVGANAGLSVGGWGGGRAGNSIGTAVGRYSKPQSGVSVYAWDSYNKYTKKSLPANRYGEYPAPYDYTGGNPTPGGAPVPPATPTIPTIPDVPDTSGQTPIPTVPEVLPDVVPEVVPDYTAGMYLTNESIADFAVDATHNPDSILGGWDECCEGAAKHLSQYAYRHPMEAVNYITAFDTNNTDVMRDIAVNNFARYANKTYKESADGFFAKMPRNITKGEDGNIGALSGNRIHAINASNPDYFEPFSESVKEAFYNRSKSLLRHNRFSDREINSLHTLSQDEIKALLVSKGITEF